MKIQFKKSKKQFTTEDGKVIDYEAREIVIDDVPYPVIKTKKDIFDYQFKELINKD